MLDFLIDNPFIVIILIYGLVSLLTGKKKRQEKALRKAQGFADKAAQVKKDPVERESYRSKIEDVLRNVGQDQIRRDRSDLIQTRFAELAFDVVLGGKAEAAVKLQARVGRFPRSLGGEIFRHVRFRAA